MNRRIALPALLLVAVTSVAAAQSPSPETPPTPQNPQNPAPQQAYPQASPRQDKNSVSPADSQQIQQGRNFARERLNTLLAGITLTPQQRGRVDSVMLRYQPDLPAGSPENATDSTLVQRWALILPRLDNEVRVALNSEQQTVWDRNVEQLRNRRPRPIGDR